MTTEEKKIQDIINKIVAQEFVVHMLYMGAITATVQSEVFFNLFTEIANEKLYEHYKNLKEFAKINEFTIPFKFKEYEKYAKKQVKRLENLKTGETAPYYLNEIILAEQDILTSYDEAINCECIPYELQAILTRTVYSVEQYIDNLYTLKYAVEASATMCDQYI